MSEAIDTTTPRGKCYHRIRHAFSGALAKYYRAHPERLNDAAGLEAEMDTALKLMQFVLAILDEYEITAMPAAEEKAEGR